MAASKFLNGIDLQNNRATNAADASAPTDLVTLQQLQNASAGLSWKDAVRLATTTDGAMGSAYAAGQSIDGVTLVLGDRILIKNQAQPRDNGIYTVNNTGAPTRATDADSIQDLQNAIVAISEGTINADKIFQMVTDNFTVGVTDLVWSPFAAGQTYTGSNGVKLVGSDFQVQNADGSITVGPAGISTTRQQIGATGKYAQDIGTMTAGTPITITHGLNTLDVTVLTRNVATGEVVDMGPVVTGVNTITVQSAAPQVSGAYRVVVTG